MGITRIAENKQNRD